MGLISSLIVKGLQTQEATDLHRVLFFPRARLHFLEAGTHDHLDPPQVHLSVAFIAETESPNKGINEICSIRFGTE